MLSDGAKYDVIHFWNAYDMAWQTETRIDQLLIQNSTLIFVAV